MLSHKKFDMINLHRFIYEMNNMPLVIVFLAVQGWIWVKCLHGFYHQKCIQSSKINVHHKSVYLNIINSIFLLTLIFFRHAIFLENSKKRVFQILSFLNCIKTIGKSKNKRWIKTNSDNKTS